MSIQALTFAGRNREYVGNTMISSGDSSPLTLNYPENSSEGDIIIAYVVAENLIVPSLPSGWTSLYSNTTTLVDGPGSGRRLMYKRKGAETSASVDVNGGGNCTCVALKNYDGTFSSVSEIGFSASVSKDISYNNGPQQIFVVLVNNDGGAVTNPTITISNTTNSYSNTPGDYRSMGIGYVNTISTNSSNVSISADSAYAISFYVT